MTAETLADAIQQIPVFVVFKFKGVAPKIEQTRAAAGAVLRIYVGIKDGVNLLHHLRILVARGGHPVEKIRRQSKAVVIPARGARVSNLQLLKKRADARIRLG